MNLPQSAKPIHSDNEWWWLLYHIAPGFLKEQNDKTSFQQDGQPQQCSKSVVMSIIHTKEQRTLGCLKKQVVGRCWMWLRLPQCLKWLPPRRYPLSGYTLCLWFKPNFTWLSISGPGGRFQISRVRVWKFTHAKDLLSFILARILESCPVWSIL